MFFAKYSLISSLGDIGGIQKREASSGQQEDTTTPKISKFSYKFAIIF